MLVFTISYLTHICIDARDTCVTCKVYQSTLESYVLMLWQAERSLHISGDHGPRYSSDRSFQDQHLEGGAWDVASLARRSFARRADPSVHDLPILGPAPRFFASSPEA
jgi:hypothetical protein